MLAHHPSTGKPIRVLRTEPKVAADAKTLVLVEPTMTPSPRWNRWFPVVTSPDAVAVCCTDKTRPQQILAVVLGQDSSYEAWSPVLPALISATSQTLFVGPRKVLSTWEKAGFVYDRVLITEELFEAYPYLGEPCTAADPLAKVIVCVAHIFRMQRIAWSLSSDRTELTSVQPVLDAWTTCIHGSLLHIPANTDDSCIPKTTLIQQWYTASPAKRHKEIKECLEKNIACPYIDSILLLNEAEYTNIPASPKITTVNIGHRMTYYDALTAAKDRVPAGDIVIIANSDIWCNETLSYLWRIGLKEHSLFLALLRWEDVATPHIFGPRPDSQDTWIFARDCLTFTPGKEEFDYPFGQSGCDNAIALDMMRHKFLVANPAYSIQTMHSHKSNVRTYDPKNILYRPFYLHCDPTAIQSVQVETNLSAYKTGAALSTVWQSTYLCESFPRPFQTLQPETADTVCSMLKHNATNPGEVVWNYAAHAQNLWTPSIKGPPLYHFTGGTFVSPGGIVSGWNNIYVGDHKGWSGRWETSNITMLTNCLRVGSMLALPCSAKCFTSLSAWVLEYLPRVIRLRSILKDAGEAVPEFGVPSQPDLGAFLQDCVWPSADPINTLPMLDDLQYYADHVWAVPPSDSATPVTREDVALLRSLLPAAASEGEKKPVAVLCVTDAPTAVLSREWADSVQEHILSGWTVKIVVPTDSVVVRREAFQSATWVIGAGDALDWLWMAPAGATVLEFMEAGAPVGSHIHLAGAAGLRCVVGTHVRDSLPNIRQAALLEVGRALKTFGFKELVAVARTPAHTEMPVIVLPTGKGLQGIFTHSGDTFREMAQIWADRGYCKIAYSEDTPYCWWGGIGEVLLYDRPTARWWNDAVPYQMALFGNCEPVDKARLRQSVWSFWPRSPRAIEMAVELHKVLRTWEDRPIKSLFLGKIENGVQLAARSTADWSNCVDLFSMPKDSTGAPYPYTQAEYIDKLCQARFGLCLPGFGKKCNREIEYFACGTVPIVTPDVDMTHYLVPPKAGVHYFVAKTPEDVRRIVAGTTRDTWRMMSIKGREWWRSYASAEGMFRLTMTRIEQCRPYFGVGIPPTLR
jgi:hypothetical protein